MKIKKGLALILALAMIITLMPTMAFASTANGAVSNNITVKADSPMPAISTYLTAQQDWNTDTIRLSLSFENATWDITPEADDVNVTADALTITKPAPTDEDPDAEAVVATVSVDSAADLNTADTRFISAEDDTLVIEISTNSALKEDDRITLDFEEGALISGSDEGAVNVIVERDSTNVITTGAIKIADVVAGTTTAAVTDKVKTYPRGDAEGAAIKITEVTADAWTNGEIEVIELTLPKNVTWDTTNGPITVTGSAVGDRALRLNNVGDVNLVDGNGDYALTNGGRTLTLAFTVQGNSGNIDSLTITPYINIGKDAAAGDIAVDLVGQDNVSDESGLVIAVYGDESVEVTTEEEVPTIVAGYVEDTKDKNFTVSVTLKESMKGSLAANRYVDFDLPEEVQICGPIEAKVNKGDQDTADRVTIEGLNGNGGAYWTEDTSGFEFQVPDGDATIADTNDWDADKANTITFEIPVTVEAGFTGDITMTVTGAKAGVEDTELVVATAEAPITVETTTTNVKNGVQTQTVADITITENFAGYMEDGDELYLGIDTLGLTAGSAAFESFDSIEVTDGNLEIGRCRVVGDNIFIPIDGESTTVSTIELKGLTLVLNRTLPEGGYDLQATGDAVVKNADTTNSVANTYNDGDFSDVAVTTEDYVVITTPADDAAGVNATFTAGQASYTVDGQTVEMDVAPFIDSNNRMLVPIRYAANAMGVSDSNIQWNSYTQTGTISGAMGVVQVTVGSTNLITSNGTITMDTVAVNSNDRIYVPVRYIANALGASVEWDPATRTATFS